jgi:hypothetical protein
MALLVDDVIDNARDLHPLLSPVNVPDGLMVRELTRGVSDLYDQIYPRNPGYLATTLEVDLTAPGFPWTGVMDDVPGVAPGIDLTTLLAGGWKDITQGEFWMGTGATARRVCVATFAPWEQRQLCSKFPAFTLRDNALYFLGAQGFYNRFSLFRLVYTPAPVDLVLGGTIALPHDAREPLMSRLALFGMMRMVGNPEFKITAADVQPFSVRAAGERAEFLTAIWRVAQRQRYTVRDVRPDPGGAFGPGLS